MGADFLNSRTDDDPVFGLWRRLDIAANFPEELEIALEQSFVNPLLRAHIKSANPSSMVELAQAYGKLLEQTYEEWTALTKRNPQQLVFALAAKEELRDVLYGDQSPAVLSDFETVDCYSLDEHVEMRNLAGKVEQASLEHPDRAPRAMILRQSQTRFHPVVFVRGRPDQPGRQVPVKVPSIFSPEDAGLSENRLHLARSIASPANPLTARVIVNRVWQWHFGQPLVATPSDFGLRSSMPTHRKLLDFLAYWFMENDWSLKALHRKIMSSHVYQQASLARPDGMDADPDNRLLWRFPAHRLEWEVIRDSLLTVSGRIELSQGGKPIAMSPDDPDSRSRTIYLQIDRQEIPRFAKYFDFPAPDFTSPGRPISIVPQQQLFFLNSPFVYAQASAVGDRVQAMDSDRLSRFKRAHQIILGRDPDMKDEEIRETLDDLNQVAADSGKNLWSIVALAMLQSNEFLLLE